MRHANLKKNLAYSLSVLALSAALCGALWASEPELSLRWALGAWNGDGDTPDAIQRDTRLGAGTRLKFLVEPTSPSTVYLLLQDTDRAIHVLYRESSALQTDGQGSPTYIPPGSQYFELDDAAGVDTFFLLASKEPLTELEALLDRYESVEQPAARTELEAQIIGEIRRQHKAHRDFSRPVEKPVMIGGQTRGDAGSITDAIDRLALEVSSDSFYSKTITIDHE